MSIKLVIVDDAPFIREAIRGLIDGSEIECVGEATNGLEAIQVIIKKKPDVVLMDLVMPEKNGIEASKEIFAMDSSVRIIACSTEGQEELILKALDAGCCNYISKPFSKAQLMKVIRSAAAK